MAFAFYRWTILLASYLVPAASRQSWLAHWQAEVRDLWALLERGELPLSGWWELGGLCRLAWFDAWWQRFNRERWPRVLQSPLLPFAAMAVVVGITAIVSRGFAKTQFLIALILGPPVPRGRLSDSLMVHAAPLLFAVVIAAVMLSKNRIRLRSFGWHYSTYFILKVVALQATVYLLWVENGALLRASIRNEHARILIGGLIWTLLFVFVVAYAIWWSLADQRRRCPVCLRCLAMPVTIGTWSSVFEPAKTELMCEEGHGSLCLPDSIDDSSAEWVALDASWQEMFAQK